MTYYSLNGLFARRFTRLLALLAMGAALWLSLPAFAAPSPQLIPFQGRLTNPQGVPYNSGQYTITFNLYDQAVGGANLWTETHAKVGVINGMVNVFLGSINPLTNVSFAETRHLGITIDADNNSNTADPEMVPRQMIIPAFWAKNSEKLAGQDWTPVFGVNSPLGSLPGSKIQAQSIAASQIASNTITAGQISPNTITSNQIAPGAISGSQIAAGTLSANSFSLQLALDALIPAGTIVAFGGGAPPSGWLVCDGAEISRSSRLGSVILSSWGPGNGSSTFNLPDLRGVFLRGVNGGRGDQFADPGDVRVAVRSGAASGNAVGSYQGDQLATHTHNAPIYDLASGSANQGFINTAGANTGFKQTSQTGGNETRPKNAYVNYIIKN